MTDEPEPQNSPTHRITVGHVYDFASQLTTTAYDELKDLIGKDLARDYLLRFLPAFETLEALAERTEKDRHKIAQLEHTIHTMENDRANRIKQMDEREKEMLEFEEHYGTENKNLWEMCERLKSEKNVLQQKVDQLAEETVEEKEKQGYVVVGEQEFQLLLNLKQQNVELQDRIRDLHHQIRQVEHNEEDLKKSLEKALNQTKVMLRKNDSLKGQCRALVSERNTLGEQLERVQEANIRLEKVVKETSATCNDLKNQQENTLREEPQFSLNELHQLIKENTEMKCKLLKLDTKLDLDRPESSSGDSNEASDTYDNDDVVYGPINREPDEKLYPWKYQRKTSGIIKFTWDAAEI